MNLGVQSQLPTSQGALTRVRRAPAVSSTKMDALSWSWRYEAGQRGVTSPSVMAFTASALSSPQAITMILDALSIVLMPMVIAADGVAEMSPLKLCACLLRDLYGSGTVRVRLFSLAPASLKPSWPCSPTPITRRSSPRASLSNSAQYAEIFSAGTVPSGMCTFSLRMSTLSIRASWIRLLRLWCWSARKG